MTMLGPPGRGGGFRGVDEAAQRRQNAQAPRVRNLGSRVVALFRPYAGRIAVTAVLVIAAALTVRPREAAVSAEVSRQ